MIKSSRRQWRKDEDQQEAATKGATRGSDVSSSIRQCREEDKQQKAKTRGT